MGYTIKLDLNDSDLQALETDTLIDSLSNAMYRQASLQICLYTFAVCFKLN